jgi:hypothetical protein
MERKRKGEREIETAIIRERKSDKRKENETEIQREREKGDKIF